ncbi:MAG: CinA family protein [Coriobacteriales bacterium]|jgi:nicotinamide-nucleotide amidase|nr:CinA family protein [Coriobacteriales bacterium]
MSVSLPACLIEEAVRVLDLARDAGLTIGCAESCTGGLIAASLTSVPGASEVFWGGVVSYDPSVKRAVLGVDAHTIATLGVVSRDCALQMARGARATLGVAAAVSTTGIAGPGGAEAGKPVGTVWIAVAGPTGERAIRHTFRGDRDAVREAATREALRLLADLIRLGV